MLLRMVDHGEIEEDAGPRADHAEVAEKPADHSQRQHVVDERPQSLLMIAEEKSKETQRIVNVEEVDAADDEVRSQGLFTGAGRVPEKRDHAALWHEPASPR